MKKKKEKSHLPQLPFVGGPVLTYVQGLLLYFLDCDVSIIFPGSEFLFLDTLVLAALPRKPF